MVTVINFLTTVIPSKSTGSSKLKECALYYLKKEKHAVA